MPREFLLLLKCEQLRVARRGWPVLAVFVPANFAAYTVLDQTHAGDQAYALLNLVLWAAGYVLLVGLMQRAGYLARGKAGGPGTYLIIGLAYGVAVLIGFVLLVVPGLYLVMRWLAAYPHAVTSGDILASLKRSWTMTARHQPELSLALLGPVGLYCIVVGLPLLVAIDRDLAAEPLSLIANLAFAFAFAWLTILEIAAFGVLTGIQGTPERIAPEEVPA